MNLTDFLPALEATGKSDPSTLIDTVRHYLNQHVPAYQRARQHDLDQMLQLYQCVAEDDREAWKTHSQLSVEHLDWLCGYYVAYGEMHALREGVGLLRGLPSREAADRQFEAFLNKRTTLQKIRTAQKHQKAAAALLEEQDRPLLADYCESRAKLSRACYGTCLIAGYLLQRRRWMPDAEALTDIPDKLMQFEMEDAPTPKE